MVRSNTQVLLLSLLLGAYYTGVIGFGAIGFGLGATLGNILFLGSILFLFRQENQTFTPMHYALAAIGSALSLFALLTTNPLLMVLNHAVVTCIFSLFLLTLYLGDMPTTATSYTLNLLRYTFLGFIEVAFGSLGLKMFTFLRIPGVKLPKVPKDIGTGMLVSIPILIVFHLLFTQINAEYARFVAQFFAELWRIIRLIIDIEFIWFLLKTWISSYVIYTVLSMKAPATDAAKKKVDSQLRMFLVILGLTMALFALFSVFQSKLLVVDMAKLAFKTLSEYTQQGFWELVGVAVLGYSLCLWVIGKIQKDAAEARSLRQLLTLFSAELILITVFSYHKLFWLQYLFGLKDQRIMATCGVFLITLTCGLFIGRIWKKLSSSQIFFTQLFGLLLITLFLNGLNMDAFLTRTYPISYYVKGVKYKDYSYLLGNSYDNYGQWIGLMHEATKAALPQPESYYWGWYQPLCNAVRNYDFQMRQDRVSSSTYLSHRFGALERYGKLHWGMPLTELARVNWREYQAYLLVKSNKKTVDDFLTFAKARCTPNTLPQSKIQSR